MEGRERKFLGSEINNSLKQEFLLPSSKPVFRSLNVFIRLKSSRLLFRKVGTRRQSFAAYLVMFYLGIRLLLWLELGYFLFGWLFLALH